MIIEKKTKDGVTVWRLDRKKRYYQYCVQPGSAQGQVIPVLNFHGYTRQPTNLNANGYGFSRSLRPLFFIIKETFGKLESITVSDKLQCRVNKDGRRRSITFNKDLYDSLVRICLDKYRDNAKTHKETTYGQLSGLFPKYFKRPKKANVYQGNSLAELLSKKELEQHLSVDDMNKLADVLPTIVDKSIAIKKSILRKVLFAQINDKVNKVRLDSIISEYERLLAKSVQVEPDWQKFIRENILFINSSYMDLVEKKNISLRAAIPDFLLLDGFQFVDVFEIKRPDFKCLNYDKSHDNYFWSAEVSKALAQVEKYLFDLENHANSLMVTLRQQGYDINIVRPRGFVLIGKREDFQNARERDAFKILNSSLKNVQVILYDDFLDSIKFKYMKINR